MMFRAVPKGLPTAKGLSEPRGFCPGDILQPAPRPAHSLRNLAAYTLIEVVVAASLLGFMFVALLAGMSYGFATTQASRENLRATQVMLERMEGLRLYNWNQLVYSNWIPGTFTNWYFPLTNSGESLGVMYTGTMTVTNNDLLPDTSYSDDMRAVVVTINWNSGNIAHTRTLTTFVARNGMQNYIFNN